MKLPNGLPDRNLRMTEVRCSVRPVTNNWDWVGWRDRIVLKINVQSNTREKHLKMFIRDYHEYMTEYIEYLLRTNFISISIFLKWQLNAPPFIWNSRVAI